MSSGAAAAEHPWRSQVFFGDAVAAQRSALVVASYPLLLLLVILAAFVRYLWVALTMYCALLFALSCAARSFATANRPAAEAAARMRVSHGGLSAAAIAAVAPAFPYKPAAAVSAIGDAAVQCAVCLEAMRDGEAARRLPACSHAFHAGCIDMWLDSHATCPVCRSHVVPLPHKAGKQPPEPEPLLVHPSPESPLPPV